MICKQNVGLVFMVIGLALSAEGTSTLNYTCSVLDLIPTPYQRNGTVLKNFPRSCKINGNFTDSLDFFTLLEKEKVPVGFEDYFTVDVHLKCSAPYKLEFSNISSSNLKMILSLRLEDCHVEWTDIDKLGQSVYLIELALTYIHILPLQSNTLATKILPGLNNTLETTLGINFNLIADVLHIEKALPVFPALSAMVLMCYDSTFNTTSCNNETNHRVRVNTKWLQTTYPELQTLVLIGVIPSDNFSHLNFPWNNSTRYLPLNLSRTSYLQKIYTLDVGGHGLSNELRRFLDISYAGITIDQVCPINGHVDKIALRFLGVKERSFPYDCFWNTWNITYIDIRGLNIGSVPNDTFKDMRQLQYLAISGGNITEIKPGTFDDLESLSFLSLDNNNIGYIKAGTMSNLTSLKTLFLHNNSIHFIESDSLPTYKILSFVDVRWNNLSALVNDCLKLPKLAMCDMEYNHISLKNLQQILRNKVFDPIRLSIVDPYGYEGQPSGHYAEGYIHENEQSHLNLRNNGPAFIPFDATIWNRFEQLQFLTFLSWFQIDMGNNNLYCGGSLYNLKQWIQDNTTSIWRQLKLAKYPGFSLVVADNFASWKCSAPLDEWINGLHTAGPFMEINDRDFLRQLKITGCPHGCGCYESTSAIDSLYAIYCQHRNLHEFPQHVPLLSDRKKLYAFFGKNEIESLPGPQDNQTQVSGNISIVPYSWLKRVTFLDLYQNRITADAHTLQSFFGLLGDKLEVLKLDGNNIQSIPTSIRDFPSLKEIVLPDDKITCCNSAWMKCWLRNSSHIVRNSYNLKCNSPKLGLMPIVEMKDRQFVCSEPGVLRFLAFLLLIPAVLIPLRLDKSNVTIVFRNSPKPRVRECLSSYRDIGTSTELQKSDFATKYTTCSYQAVMFEAYYDVNTLIWFTSKCTVYLMLKIREDSRTNKVCIKHADEIKILVFEKIGIKLTFKKIARDDSKKYDAVLMYADQDHEWCAQTLLPHLEEGYKYNIFFKHRDGDLGDFACLQNTNSLLESCRAIVVMSNSFISDPDCMAFFSEARSYSTDKRFVLVIKLEHLRLDSENVTHMDIFNFMRTNFYVDIEMKRCLARLCYWMPDRKANELPRITENLPAGLREINSHDVFSGFGSDLVGDDHEAGGSLSRQPLLT